MLYNIIIGKRITIRILDLLISELKKAKSLGMFDVLGGGALVTWIKRKRIQECENLAKAVNVLLSSFRNRLDRDEAVHLNLVDIFDETMFVDYFFGLPGSLIVQDKIEFNLEIAKEVRSSLAHCLSVLENSD